MRRTWRVSALVVVLAATLAACNSAPAAENGTLESDQIRYVAEHADAITSVLIDKDGLNMEPLYYTKWGERPPAVYFVPLGVAMQDLCTQYTVTSCRDKGMFEKPSIERALRNEIDAKGPGRLKFNFSNDLRVYGQRVLADGSTEKFSCRRGAVKADAKKLKLSILGLPGMATKIEIVKGQTFGLQDKVESNGLEWNCARDLIPPSPKPSP